MSSQTRLAQLLQFVSEEPDDVFINYALGIEYVSIGNVESAIEFFEKTLLIDQNYIAAFYQQGKLFEAIDSAKAKQFYTQGIAVAQKLNKPQPLKELKEALALLSDDEE